MPSATPHVPTAQKGVSLRGVEAVQWLAARGSQVLDQREVALVTDEVAGGGFRLARIWHTAASIELTVDAGRVLIVLPVEGGVTLDSARAGLSTPLSPGDALVLAHGSVTSSTAAASVARFEVVLDAAMIPGPQRELIGAHLVLSAVTPALRSTLIAASNAALNSDFDPRSQGFPALRLAFAHLAVAVVTSHLGDDSREKYSHREVLLYRSATEIISQRAHDPLFTIAALAHELRISERYLHRVFSAAGTSPAAEIRAARTAIARSYSAGEAGRVLPATEVARLAGFRNITALRRALRQTG